MSSLEHYYAVLADLREKRNQLEKEIAGITSAIGAIERIMPGQPSAPSAVNVAPVGSRSALATIPIEPPAIALPVTSGVYANMSVRWACLALLSEHPNETLSTSVIAKTLLAGGVTTNGRNFNGNVSAVLSNMSRERNEVETTSEGWKITEQGKSAWSYISAKRDAQMGAQMEIAPTAS
jgi:hypothetical protein